MSRSLGYVLWEGPSRLDGTPIVAIATGLGLRASSNRKTGDMVQVWILPASVDPLTAVRTGDDAAVCGDCPLRGIGGNARACYVTMHQAPLAVWRTWKAGRYKPAPRSLRFRLPLRWGTYGDPAALPASVVARWTRRADAGWTGYSHSWRTLKGRDRAVLRSTVMASCDSAQDERDAAALGWRTFRIVPDDGGRSLRRRRTDPTLPKVVHCPAVATGSTCGECQLCDGAHGPTDRRRSIVLEAHGPGRSAFPRALARVDASHGTEVGS